MQNAYFNVKNFWNFIFRASRRASYHIFPRLHLIMGVCLGGWNPYYFLKGFVDHVTIFNSSSMQHVRWSYLLETVVDSCYIELCLKCDRTPRSDSEMHRSV